MPTRNRPTANGETSTTGEANTVRSAPAAPVDDAHRITYSVSVSPEQHQWLGSTAGILGITRHKLMDRIIDSYRAALKDRVVSGGVERSPL